MWSVWGALIRFCRKSHQEGQKLEAAHVAASMLHDAASFPYT
jgi:hypothetical protein